MRSRWTMLAVLFAVRATMAFQFQSVAAVAPLLGREFEVSLADIGFLIGLYFAPGAALALPGGAIGQKFGDRATVLAGLALMIAGGLIMALATSWGGQVSGRLVAGIGGVLLNVLMTKMVADWFSGREISTAMAIFINSWPVGLAISLLILPPIGAAYGVSAVYFAVTMLIATGLLLLAALYVPPAVSTTMAIAKTSLDRNTTVAVIAAGLVWSFYNIGFAMIFSFGPAMLAERGWSITVAGLTTSIVLWLAALSVPFGGFLADRTKRPDVILVAGCILFAMLLILASRGEAVVSTIVALGIVCGLAAGPIMNLPARVLEPGTRAVGMGVFYTVFYVGMMLGPTLGGRYATWAGTARAAFDFGAAMVLACPLVLVVFHRIFFGQQCRSMKTTVPTVVGLLFLVCAMHYSTSSAAAHSWYPKECCSGRDCAPVEQTAWYVPTGGRLPLLIVTSRLGTAIIPHDFPVRQSKDSRMHVCIQDVYVVCLFMPPSQ